jgi:hypothetical protein
VKNARRRLCVGWCWLFSRPAPTYLRPAQHLPAKNPLTRAQLPAPCSVLVEACVFTQTGMLLLACPRYGMLSTAGGKLPSPCLLDPPRRGSVAIRKFTNTKVSSPAMRDHGPSKPAAGAKPELGHRKTVAIVGGGASGIVSAKYIQASTHTLPVSRTWWGPVGPNCRHATFKA